MSNTDSAVTIAISSMLSIGLCILIIIGDGSSLPTESEVIPKIIGSIGIILMSNISGYHIHKVGR